MSTHKGIAEGFAEEVAIYIYIYIYKIIMPSYCVGVIGLH